MNLGDLNIYFQIPAFLAALFALTKGADWLVEGASGLALKLGVSELVVGLTVIAMGTSAPEFAVSGYAAWEGTGGISLGNVVGSNIFNLGFILGITVLAMPVVVSKDLIKRDGLILVASCLLLSFMCFTGDELARWEGAVMFLGLAAYLIYLWRTQHKDPSSASVELPSQENSEGMSEPRRFSMTKSLGLSLAGLVLLLVGSRIIVDLAVAFARYFGMSEWLIGVTIVAAGTSLPELVTSVASVIKRKSDIGIGNLIGSDIFNILGVMGFASMLNPIEVSTESFSSLGWMIFTVVALLLMMRHKMRLTRIHGAALVTISVVRWTLDFLR